MKYLMQGSSSTKSQKMLLQLFLVSITVNAVSSQLIATTSANCTSYLRKPDYADISVECGTNYISLAIQLCPAVYSGFNESQLFLNNIMNDPNCKGTVDTTVAPPVLRFSFPINVTNGCGSTLTTTSAQGTGIFSDFSNIQTVNISGVVKSYDPSSSVVTYNTDLKYFYSCSYPLEYLINNTQLDVSSSAIAVKDRNGSFISTLSLRLYSDAAYTTPLVIPSQGIELKSNVFVLVQATNLTTQYMVLLDRCYASVSPFPATSTFYNFFVGCTKDQLTNITENGQSQRARFSFPAFRFMEQQNQTISRYYLHCITRLCETATCNNIIRSCSAGRRKRDVEPTSSSLLVDGLTDPTTLISPLIITRADTAASSKEQALSGSNTRSDSSVGLAVTVGILAFVCIGIIGAAVIFYKKLLTSGASKIFHG
ncbi:zona pellucida-like domain-containing protein 1 [Colossoma macropomum]|uniref:zona pellucida-like domain-containing protein 1 n=1 Tax=Colossoma macropomum TaxID=42526 RepID=UPI001864CE0A|nr:zona pellucida-like domain-containing protein 1 [Colossoma macropomum]